MSTKDELPQGEPGEVWCYSEPDGSGFDPVGYGCTRPIGHEGDHAAYGSSEPDAEPLKAWRRSAGAA